MRALLISTYDLGRQPFGLASPAAWLRREGVDVECVDVSRDGLDDSRIAAAGLIALYLPMHTATRLAAPLLDRIERLNPGAPLAAYGLYAPLNAAWLKARGVRHVFGPEAEADLAALASAAGPRVSDADGPAAEIPRLRLIQPDRSTLPALSRYAALQMPDGRRKVVGATEATRGCKHLCRHCPIVPVYEGQFRVVPVDVVLADVRAQVEGGAQHISFGDPDFLNGPTHARRVLEGFATEFSGLTYDVTIKVEHLLRHRDLLGVLRDTGCLFITSAVESVDDHVLDRLAKGHTRADFVEVVELCRAAGVTLAPTFVPFTPWTTIDGYGDLLDQIARLGIIEAVAPVQLAIRLLVTAESKLLDLSEIREAVAPFDAESLTFPWQHADPRVDQLQRRVMEIVASGAGAPRLGLFERIRACVDEIQDTGQSASRGLAGDTVSRPAGEGTPPFMTEGWYCCAEPGQELFDLM